MPVGKISDKFVNVARISITESAANTLTFNQIQTGVAIFEKVAWVIHRILWFPTNTTISLLTAAADQLTMALTTSDQLTSLATDQAGVIAQKRLQRIDFGTAASGQMYEVPLESDFSTLPSGGLIVPTAPLYGACVGVSLGSAITFTARVYFTYKTLKAEEYWELVESTRIVS